MMKIRTTLILSTLLCASSLHANEVEVVSVKVHPGSNGYRFDVTLRHADTGWEHYTNKWDVVAPDGTVLGTRVLYHPHVDEQPFTRSLGGVKIPAGITSVTIRAHDLAHKYGGKKITINLPK